MIVFRIGGSRERKEIYVLREGAWGTILRIHGTLTGSFRVLFLQSSFLQVWSHFPGTTCIRINTDIRQETFELEPDILTCYKVWCYASSGTPLLMSSQVLGIASWTSGTKKLALTLYLNKMLQEQFLLHWQLALIIDSLLTLNEYLEA